MRVCVLCLEAITVVVCDVAVTESVFLAFRPAVCLSAEMHCMNVGCSEPQYLSGTFVRGCRCCFQVQRVTVDSVQPVCSRGHCKSKFLLCIIYNC